MALLDFHEKDGHGTRPGFQRAAQAENPIEQMSYVVHDNAVGMRRDSNGNNAETVGVGWQAFGDPQAEVAHAASEQNARLENCREGSPLSGQGPELERLKRSGDAGRPLR
jgi:hypothetical protein